MHQKLGRWLTLSITLKEAGACLPWLIPFLHWGRLVNLWSHAGVSRSVAPSGCPCI